mgnify:CR=1 FL=1
MFKPFAELIGTFLFLSVIFFVVSRKVSLAPLIIGLTLTGLIFVIAPISGCHINPVVFILFYLNKDITLTDMLLYVLFQIIGAVCAFLLIKNVI